MGNKNEEQKVLQKIRQEYDNSMGALALSREEMAAYFQIDQEMILRIIDLVTTTGKYELQNVSDGLTGEEVERLQIHSKYQRNYWLKGQLVPEEAKILLELGTLLAHPFNTRRKQIEIENRRVVGLDLRHQNLVHIPDSIGELTKLRTIILKDNRLKTLPESIGKLINLKTLDIENNQIVNQEEWIDKVRPLLKNLQYLWWSDSRGIRYNDSKQIPPPRPRVQFPRPRKPLPEGKSLESHLITVHLSTHEGFMIYNPSISVKEQHEKLIVGDIFRTEEDFGERATMIVEAGNRINAITFVVLDKENEFRDYNYFCNDLLIFIKKIEEIYFEELKDLIFQPKGAFSGIGTLIKDHFTDYHIGSFGDMLYRKSIK